MPPGGAIIPTPAKYVELSLRGKPPAALGVSSASPGRRKPDRDDGREPVASSVMNMNRLVPPGPGVPVSESRPGVL